MAASSDNRGNERSGGGEQEEEARTDGWMTTYSDMVTLLLTFFVLMFALSNVDNERVELFLFAMSRDGLTAEQFWEIRDRHDIDFTDGDEWDDMLPWPSPAEDDDAGFGYHQNDDEEGESPGERSIRLLAEALGLYIDEHGLADNIGILYYGESLMITIASDILFEPGRADITPIMEETAEAIGGLLAANIDYDDPFEIIISGHTDNVPMGAHAHLFPTNWHLSLGRAAVFLELLLDAGDLEPPLFYARGNGEHRPIDTNDTPEGRQRNRRVEVMITLARTNPMWHGSNAVDY